MGGTAFDPLSPFGTAHLRAKSRLRRLRSETRLRTQPFDVRGAWGTVRVRREAEKSSVHLRSAANTGYSRMELPLQKRGAGRSPEGINAAGSRIRTNCGEHSTSRSLFCIAADPPECSIFLGLYRFDPLSPFGTAPLLCKGSLGAVRICREAEKSSVHLCGGGWKTPQRWFPCGV